MNYSKNYLMNIFRQYSLAITFEQSKLNKGYMSLEWIKTHFASFFFLNVKYESFSYFFPFLQRLSSNIRSSCWNIAGKNFGDYSGPQVPVRYHLNALDFRPTSTWKDACKMKIIHQSEILLKVGVSGLVRRNVRGSSNDDSSYSVQVH